MKKILWNLRISLSNLLDCFQWYRKWLGGEWYLVKVQMQTHLLIFWVKRYDGDNFDNLRDRNNPYADILDIEKYE
jgi:hypothetical protein